MVSSKTRQESAVESDEGPETQLSKAIKKARARLGLSQAALAQQASLTEGYISKIESGASVPRDDTRRRILQSLGLNEATLQSEHSVEEDSVSESEPINFTGRTLGTIIKETRRRLKISQRSFAAAIGKVPSFLSRVESNQMLPGAKTVGQIARELQLDVNELLQLRERLYAARKEAAQQARLVTFLEQGGVPRTPEQRLGEVILGSPNLRESVEHLREIADDPDLFPVALNLLRTLVSSRRTKKRNLQ